MASQRTREVSPEHRVGVRQLMTHGTPVLQEPRGRGYTAQAGGGVKDRTYPQQRQAPKRKCIRMQTQRKCMFAYLQGHGHCLRPVAVLPRPCSPDTASAPPIAGPTMRGPLAPPGATHSGSCVDPEAPGSAWLVHGPLHAGSQTLRLSNMMNMSTLCSPGPPS